MGLLIALLYSVFLKSRAVWGEWGVKFLRLQKELREKSVHAYHTSCGATEF